MKSYQMERLASGFTTVVIETPAAHQVQITLMLRLGNRSEQIDSMGISHFLEHVVFRGSKAFPKGDLLSEAFEATGGQLNAVTGVESTEYYMVAHPARLAGALDVLAGMIREPVFGGMEQERAIIGEEVSYDYTQKGELNHLPSLASDLLWPDHPLGWPVGGTPQTVAKISKEDLMAHHKTHYTPGNMVLVLAGQVSAAQGFAFARSCFGDWENPALPLEGPLPAPPPLQSSGPTSKLVADADNQFHLQLSFPAPGYNDPKQLSLGFLSRVLDDGPTSYLQKIIREERALVYALNADYNGYFDTGQFDIATSVKTNRLEALLTHLLGSLQAFCQEGPTQKDLARARERAFHAMEFSRDSLESLTDRYGWPFLFSTVRDFEEEWAELESFSPEAMHAQARETFRPDALKFVMVGPLDNQVEYTVKKALDAYAQSGWKDN